MLPVLARDEEKQATTQESMFNFVRLSDGGEDAPSGEFRSEVEVICAPGRSPAPAGPFPFETMTSHDAVRRAMAAVVPGIRARRLDRRDQDGVPDPRADLPRADVRDALRPGPRPGDGAPVVPARPGRSSG